ncbi:unnamed protein product [Schistosoma margrebowiei]|uniref:Uncharacterized protein n=1 Tax=Schistosoma margrebowiei TaxID=48269 RepID=A0A183M752_9TREM|nr:unnamed protein product [Schistosoma margrebowiei]
MESGTRVSSYLGLVSSTYLYLSVDVHSRTRTHYRSHQTLSRVNGLGISIVGSGVDTSSGEQKLSIFIKSFTPGGAAEADGR